MERVLFFVILCCFLLINVSASIYYVDEELGEGAQCERSNPCTVSTALEKVDISVLHFVGSKRQVLDFEDSEYVIETESLTITADVGIILSTTQRNIFTVASETCEKITVVFQDLVFEDMFTEGCVLNFPVEEDDYDDMNGGGNCDGLPPEDPCWGKSNCDGLPPEDPCWGDKNCDGLPPEDPCWGDKNCDGLPPEDPCWGNSNCDGLPPEDKCWECDGLPPEDACWTNRRNSRRGNCDGLPPEDICWTCDPLPPEDLCWSHPQCAGLPPEDACWSTSPCDGLPPEDPCWEHPNCASFPPEDICWTCDPLPPGDKCWSHPQCVGLPPEDACWSTSPCDGLPPEDKCWTNPECFGLPDNDPCWPSSPCDGRPPEDPCWEHPNCAHLPSEDICWICDPNPLDDPCWSHPQCVGLPPEDACWSTSPCDGLPLEDPCWEHPNCANFPPEDICWICDPLPPGDKCWSHPQCVGLPPEDACWSTSPCEGLPPEDKCWANPECFGLPDNDSCWPASNCDGLPPEDPCWGGTSKCDGLPPEDPCWGGGTSNCDGLPPEDPCWGGSSSKCDGLPPEDPCWNDMDLGDVYTCGLLLVETDSCEEIVIDIEFINVLFVDSGEMNVFATTENTTARIGYFHAKNITVRQTSISVQPFASDSDPIVLIEDSLFAADGEDEKEMALLHILDESDDGGYLTITLEDTTFIGCGLNVYFDREVFPETEKNELNIVNCQFQNYQKYDPLLEIKTYVRVDVNFNNTEFTNISRMYHDEWSLSGPEVVLTYNDQNDATSSGFVNSVNFFNCSFANTTLKRRTSYCSNCHLFHHDPWTHFDFIYIDSIDVVPGTLFFQAKSSLDLSFEKVDFYGRRIKSTRSDFDSNMQHHHTDPKFSGTFMMLVSSGDGESEPNGDVELVVKDCYFEGYYQSDYNHYNIYNQGNLFSVYFDEWSQAVKNLDVVFENVDIVADEIDIFDDQEVASTSWFNLRATGNANLEIRECSWQTSAAYGAVIYAKGNTYFSVEDSYFRGFLNLENGNWQRMLDDDIPGYFHDVHETFAGAGLDIRSEGYVTGQVSGSRFSQFYSKNEGAGLRTASFDQWGSTYGISIHIEDTTFDNLIASDGGAAYGSMAWTQSDCSLNISQSRFSDCVAQQGGALRLNWYDLNIQNSVFADNWAHMQAGAIYVQDGVFISTSNVFEGNGAFWDGGAVLVNGNGVIKASNTTFRGNSVTSNEEMSMGGGAVMIMSFQINEFDFENKDDDTMGGEVQYSLFDNCTFDNNFAETKGGDIVFNQGYNVVRDCVFQYSLTRGDGGAIYGEFSRLEIEDSYFRQSVADHYGGGIFFTSNQGQFLIMMLKNVWMTYCSAESGGAIALYRSLAQIQDSRIENNFASNKGGGLFLQKSQVFFDEGDGSMDEFYVSREDMMGEATSSSWVDGKEIFQREKICNSSLDFDYFTDIYNTTFIQSNEAKFGGGVAIEPDSEFFVKEHLLEVSYNTAVLGGAFYLENKLIFSKTPLLIENNIAHFGGAFAMELNSLIKGASGMELPAVLNSCFKIGTNQVQEFGREIFLTHFRYNGMGRWFEEQDFELWFDFECVADDGSCDDYSSPPVAIIPYIDGVLVEESEDAVYSQVIERYSFEPFDIVVGVKDFRDNFLHSYIDDFKLELKSDAEIITSSEKEQQFSEGQVVFSSLQVRGELDEEIEFTVKNDDLEIESIISVLIVECGIGFENVTDMITGITTCDPCFRNTFKFEPGMFRCRECPTGCECVTPTEISVNPGYWFVLAQDNEARTIVNVYECDSGYCDGGHISLQTDGMGNVSFSQSHLNCTAHRNGDFPLCKVCDEEYTMMNGECVLCTTRFNILPLLRIFLMEVFMLGYVHVASQKESGEPNSSLRILLDFCQIISIVLDFRSWSRNSKIYSTVSGALNQFVDAFMDFFSFAKSITNFSPNFGVFFSNMGSVEDCPFPLQGFFSLFFKTSQPFIPIFLVLPPLVFGSIYYCIVYARKRRNRKRQIQPEISENVILGSSTQVQMMGQHNEEEEEDSVDDYRITDDSSTDDIIKHQSVKKGKKEEKKGLKVVESDAAIATREAMQKHLKEKHKDEERVKSVFRKRFEKILNFIKKMFTFQGILRTFLNLFLMTHMPIFFSVIDFFIPSKNIAVGKGLVLLEYPDISFMDGSWWLWGIFFFPFSCYAFVAPIFVLIFLILFHKKSFVQDYFGSLFENYKEKYYWYEIVVILRKALLVLVSKISLSVIISRGDPNLFGIDNVFFLLVLLLALVMHLICQPFYHKIENLFETLSLVTCLVAIGLQSTNNLTTLDIAMCVLIALVIIVFVVFFVWNVITTPIVVGIFNAVKRAILKNSEGAKEEVVTVNDNEEDDNNMSDDDMQVRRRGKKLQKSKREQGIGSDLSSKTVDGSDLSSEFTIAKEDE